MQHNPRAITTLPTFSQRGAAIAKRIEDIKASAKYQALPEERKAKVRESVYNRYVPSAYANFGHSIPDKNTWVEATGRDTRIRDYNVQNKGKYQKLSESYNVDGRDAFGKDMAVGASKAWDGIALFGTRVANKTFAAMQHVDEHFSHRDDGLLAKIVIPAEKTIHRKLDNYADAERHNIQSDDFWLQTHPRNTLVGKLGSLTGEGLATLPLYAAVGTYLKAAGLVAQTAPRGVALTAKLLSTPQGKFVANRLLNASEGYLGALATSGGDQKEAVAGAAGMAIGTPLLEGAPKVIGKIASAPLIKKWAANLISVGGKPFAQDVMQSANAEMQPLSWWLKEGKQWGIKPGAALDSRELAHGIVMFPEAGTTKGHFTYEGKVYHYAKPETEEKIYDQLTRMAVEKRKLNDPVIAKLHETSKSVHESLAIAKFKKPFAALSDEEHTGVVTTYHELIEQAAEEAPVHLQEDLKKQVQGEILKARLADPELHAMMSRDEQMFGADFTETEVASTTEKIAKETGISNSNAAAKKAARASSIKNYGLKEGSSASLSPDDFIKHRTDTNAYYRTPKDRRNLNEAISDRSKAGFDKFYEQLKQADGNKIKFEKPEHRMLYHYGLGEKTPKPLREAIRYRLHQMNGFENATAEDIEKEANYMHAHILDMAYSGHLNSEEPVFASTKTQGRYNWTKWQGALSKEADKAQLGAVEAAYKLHPQALRGFRAAVRAIKETKPHITTAEEYIEFRKIVNDLSGSYLAKVPKR